MALEPCPICAENFTSSTRRRLVCNYCNQPSCRVCVEYFLLNTLEDASCMHCRKPWSREDLLSIGLTKNWVNLDYKIHRQQMFLERERANLPDAQAEIERQTARAKELQRLEDLIATTIARRESLKAHIRTLQDQIRALPDRSRANPEVVALNAQIAAVEGQVADCYATAAGYKDHIAIVKAETWQPGQTLPEVLKARGASLVVRGLMRTGLTRAEATAVAAETDLNTVAGLSLDDSVQGNNLDDIINPQPSLTNKARFIKPCPANDCRGFLSSRWKCGVCEKWVCKDCWEVKGLTEDSPHQCKPDILATVAEIRASTVLCPACGTAVYRTHGCNTMFCTHCKTGFNYATRKIIAAKTVGNPHFYEWRRQQRADATDGNPAITRPVDQGECCETLIDFDTVAAVLKRIEHRTRQQFQSVFQDIHHQVVHLEQQVLPKYQPAQPNANLDLNIQYLRKTLSENDWKVKLQQRQKQEERNAAFREIINMVIGVSHDLLDKFRTNLSLDQLAEIIGEFLALEKYANAQIARVKKLYDSSAKLEINWFDWSPVTRPMAIELHETKGLGHPPEPDRLWPGQLDWRQTLATTARPTFALTSSINRSSASFDQPINHQGRPPGGPRVVVRPTGVAAIKATATKP